MTGNQAGQSAQDMARRAREKAERLHRTAAAWEAGATGEQATGQVLSQLHPALWTTWHDVRWPGRPRANIDHVVVGPSGVFVIDTKNWSGQVQVKDGVLRQNGYSREKEVAGAGDAALAVLRLVPDVPVQPVLCLVQDEPVEGWVRDVLLCSTGNLLSMLTSRPAALSPDEVSGLTSRLEAQLARHDAGSAAPSASPSPSSPRRSSRRSRSSAPGWRLVGFLLVAVLLVGALQSGLLSKASGAIAELIVGATIEKDQPPAKDRREPADRPGKQEPKR